MEDNRTSIKKRLDDIFIEKMGYLVNRLTNDQRSKSLLSDSAGMQARDLLKLYILDSRKRDEDTTSRIAANP